MNITLTNENYIDPDGEKCHIVHILQKGTGPSYIIETYRDGEIAGSGIISENSAKKQIEYSLNNGFVLTENKI